MEFSHRGVQAQAPQNTNHVGTPSAQAHSDLSRRSKKLDGFKFGKWIRVASVILLFSITVMLLAIASLIYFGNENESGFISTSNYQAVDLNVGTSGNSSDQIYFGHIKKLNTKYLVLQDIYYIVPNAQTSPTSQNTANNNYTLVKLGCELHAPLDQMVINHDHVVFWENLKTTGTVAQKIAEYQKQNPNGATCSTPTSTTGGAASTQVTTPAPTATTPATTPTTTKKP